MDDVSSTPPSELKNQDFCIEFDLDAIDEIKDRWKSIPIHLISKLRSELFFAIVSRMSEVCFHSHFQKWSRDYFSLLNDIWKDYHISLTDVEFAFFLNHVYILVVNVKAVFTIEARPDEVFEQVLCDLIYFLETIVRSRTIVSSAILDTYKLMIEFLVCKCLIGNNQKCILYLTHQQLETVRSASRSEAGSYWNEILFSVVKYFEVESCIITSPFCGTNKSKDFCRALLSALKLSIITNNTFRQSENELATGIQAVGSAEFQPPELDAPSGYVGISNPGSICYITCIIQQFFMIEKFRDSILNDEIYSDNHIIYELKRLFYLLQYSGDCVSVLPLCSLLSNAEGDPIDIDEEADAAEFAIDLLHKIEKISSYFVSFCRGELINEIKAIGDDKDLLKFKVEPFFLIPVSICSGDTNLESVLQSFTKPETFEFSWSINKAVSDRADTSSKKNCIPTTKRVLFRHMPEIILFHVQRFQFDFRKMENNKVDSRFEFPFSVDMFPYSEAAYSETEQVTNSQDYKYSLIGVVVHKGNAQNGHYFSFIKVEVDETVQSGHKSAWVEFNDTKLRYLNPSEIGDAAFGSSTSKKKKKKQSSGSHAIILFYQKEIIEQSSSGKNCSSGVHIIQEACREDIPVDISEIDVNA